MKINQFLKKLFSFAFCGALCVCAGCKGNDPATPSGDLPQNQTENFGVAKDSDGKEIVLIENANSEYKIVVPADTSVYEDYAAKELQRFLQDATGCALSIINDDDASADTDGKYISVGNTTLFDGELDYKEFGESGGMLDVEDKTVFIAGARGYGTLNMAYRFLEYEIGWKAYAKTEIYCDKKQKLDLLAFDEYKYCPPFDFLAFQFGQFANSSTVFDAARLGLIPATSGGYTMEGNMYAAFLHNLPMNGMIGPDTTVGYEQIRKYCADEISAYMTTERIDAEYAILAEEWEKANGYAPSQEQAAELRTQAEANVELAAVKSIKATWYMGGNICLSRPEIVECATEIVKEKLLANPAAKYLMLGEGDNGASCTCDSCVEKLALYGTQGGISMWFLNSISDNLKESRFFENHPQVNPDVKLLFLNYMAYEGAPVTYDDNGNVDKVLIKANDNVGTYFCIYRACQHHALEDPSCSMNIGYFKTLKGWSAVTDTIGTYLYWANFMNYFTYFDNWASYQQWAKTLAEYGVTYNFAQCVDNYSSPLGDLRIYLMSEYFTNPDAGDFDTLVRDFMKHYYKAASTEMYKYFNAVRLHTTAIQRSAGSQCAECYDGQEGFRYMDAKWWSVETIEKLLGILNEAYQAVENSAYTEEDKQTLCDRILIEESTMRYYRYTFHESSYSDVERAAEKEWLAAAFEKLGITRMSETSPIAL